MTGPPTALVGHPWCLLDQHARDRVDGRDVVWLQGLAATQRLAGFPLRAIDGADADRAAEWLIGLGPEHVIVLLDAHLADPQTRAAVADPAVMARVLVTTSLEDAEQWPGFEVVRVCAPQWDNHLASAATDLPSAVRGDLRRWLSGLDAATRRAMALTGLNGRPLPREVFEALCPGAVGPPANDPWPRGVTDLAAAELDADIRLKLLAELVAGVPADPRDEAASVTRVAHLRSLGRDDEATALARASALHAHPQSVCAMLGSSPHGVPASTGVVAEWVEAAIEAGATEPLRACAYSSAKVDPAWPDVSRARALLALGDLATAAEALDQASGGLSERLSVARLGPDPAGLDRSAPDGAADDGVDALLARAAAATATGSPEARRLLESVRRGQAGAHVTLASATATGLDVLLDLLDGQPPAALHRAEAALESATPGTAALPLLEAAVHAARWHAGVRPADVVDPLARVAGASPDPSAARSVAASHLALALADSGQAREALAAAAAMGRCSASWLDHVLASWALSEAQLLAGRPRQALSSAAPLAGHPATGALGMALAAWAGRDLAAAAPPALGEEPPGAPNTRTHRACRAELAGLGAAGSEAALHFAAAADLWGR